MAGVHALSAVLHPRRCGHVCCHCRQAHWRALQVHRNSPGTITKSSIERRIKILILNCCFSPQKSYKYGSGLIAAAEKSRRSFQISVEPSAVLLNDHGVSWKKLSTSAAEVGERLKMARHFHALYEKVKGGLCGLYGEVVFTLYDTKLLNYTILSIIILMTTIMCCAYTACNSIPAELPIGRCIAS